MNAVVSAAASSASSAQAGTVQSAASTLVLKKAMDAQAASAAQLIDSLPQPALATSGNLGTQVNTFA